MRAGTIRMPFATCNAFEIAPMTSPAISPETTGFTCSVVTRMVGNGEVQGIGVVPPEVALNAKLVQKLHSELQSKGGVVWLAGN